MAIKGNTRPEDAVRPPIASSAYNYGASLDQQIAAQMQQMSLEEETKGEPYGSGLAAAG